MGEVTVVAAYTIPLVILTWIWLGTGKNRYLKIMVSALLPVFYILHWYSIQALKGWPSDDALPDKFYLLSAEIIEPRQETNENAAIFLWLRTEEKTAPRAYQLPYTRELHQILHTTGQRMKEGKKQIGILRTGERLGNSGTPVGHGQRLEFIDAPSLSLPPKN